jgi:DNA polymerase I-like protein with 3'-5' exonuclease and polymerase domains
VDRYLILDIETNSKEAYGRTANPYVNDVVAYSIKNNESQHTDYCKQHYDFESIVPIIAGHDVLVAHNAKFELLYLWKYPELQRWLQEGGRIYCTQLAEYNVSNYQHQWAALRDLATTKYGCPERTKWLDHLLFKNKSSRYNDVSDLPEDKVLEDVKNDVLDTEQIYLRQRDIIRQRGLEKTIEIQMDMLLSTIEIEANGFAVDRKTLEDDRAELQTELQECEIELQGLIDKYWRIDGV